MDNDPYVIIGKRLIEPLAEAFFCAIHLFVALIKAPVRLVYNFIKGGRHDQR